MSESETGTFVISLDTELAWGTFDTANGHQQYEKAYRRTPEIIEDLCSLFDKYGIPATWAVVAHLFGDCNGHSDSPRVDFDWIDDWYGSVPCESGIESTLWYAPELLEQIQSCSTEQDIGLHGYTHLILGDENCPRDAAKYEVEAAIDVLRNLGISPTSFVFPRNQVGHLDVLLESGIEVYRGPDGVWFERWNLPRTVRKPFRFATEAASWTPPAVSPRQQNGLIEVPGSQVFRPLHDGWEYTPSGTQIKRAKKGLVRAATTGDIFHLRFHPFDLGFDKTHLLEGLETVLAYAGNLRNQGNLKFKSLATIGSEYSH